LKGRRITTMIVADSGPGHTDVFTGLCVRKQNDRCTQYAPEGTMASYGSGRGREQQIAQALVNQFVSGTMVAALPGSRPTAVAAVAPVVTATGGSSAVRRPPPRLVATTPGIPTVPTSSAGSRPPPPRRQVPPAARADTRNFSSTLWIEEALGSMR